MDNMYSLSFPMNLGIGFDEMFDRFHRITEHANQGNYPPYNIIDENENESILELAVAGFTDDDLEVEVDGNKLTVSGNKNIKLDDAKYRHKGIAYRNFTRTWALAEHIQVNGASAADGILRIYLERIVPDELKPKKIDIVSDRKLLAKTKKTKK